MNKLIHTFFLLIAFYGGVNAQQTDSIPPIPAMRQLHHEYIIRSFSAIKAYAATNNKLSNQDFNLAGQLITKLRSKIELSTEIDNNAKYTWLRGVNDLLQGYFTNYQSTKTTSTPLSVLLNTYQIAMTEQLTGGSIAPLMKLLDLESAIVVTENFALASNRGMTAAKDSILVKQCNH